ncbi:glycosyltransferase family 25 protein [Acinetobacter guillouiae]|uniref:Glycosyltransferase family 25 protein n=1 Tax=Acinetobacter guillouiae TaxID=106649 RepID=A0A8X8GF75_ACIGI|nr:glycosyltransferase family 25 protein [Acinetobacter guillouiae]MCF0262995.1 glycosyltransferase family 25 protein [Acinetobacter guillouiae]
MNFVISLASAKERRLHIINEFEAQNIEFYFFDAIQPNQIPSMEEKYEVSLINSGLTAGEKACFFSHVEIWNMVASKGMKHVAIFEDDVFLGNNANSFLKSLDWIPPKINIIKLEMFEEYVLMSLNKIPLENNRLLRELKEKHLGTAGYILSLEGARNYLKYIKDKNVEVPLDRLMFENYLNDGDELVYQMVPGLSAQADRIGKSELESQLEIDRKENQLGKEKRKQKLAFMQKLKREILRFLYQVRIKFCKIGFY